MHKKHLHFEPKRGVIRCAIYTRKSSEEGLEQEFNSLDAQREACVSYINSQKHEGWVGLPDMYDDGGFSGGTMERPALARLLEDIKTKQIDTIVVYKVDRLTRSLNDFAKIVDIFDRHKVSFVSVTQQFNTTTSMGRLTLNMLLSFAQFEREVTSERIRDKFAASKKKGMWMGGVPPLGYDVRDRKLVVNEVEAETVRHIFRRYSDLGSVDETRHEISEHGVRSKTRVNKFGKKSGGNVFSRGALFDLLQNPAYRGLTVHRDKRYPGEHEPIVDEVLWTKVQERVSANRLERVTRSKAAFPSLLASLVHDDTGRLLTPTQTTKRGIRYRYYISNGLVTDGRSRNPMGVRIPAGELEAVVEQKIQQFLSDELRIYTALEVEHTDSVANHDISKRIVELGHQWPKLTLAKKRFVLLTLVDRVIVGRGTINVQILSKRLSRIAQNDELIEIVRIPRQKEEDVITLTVPAQLKRSGTEMKLLVENCSLRTRKKADYSLHRLLAKAHQYKSTVLQSDGRSIAKLAAEADVSASYFARVFRLAFLAPDVVKGILRDNHPLEITAKHLANEMQIPISWDEQRKLFRMPSVDVR